MHLFVYLFVYVFILFVCLFILFYLFLSFLIYCLFFVCLFGRLVGWLVCWLVGWLVCLFVCLLAWLFVWLFVCLFVCVCLCVCLCVCVCVCVCLFVWLIVCLFVRSFIYLSIYDLNLKRMNLRFLEAHARCLTVRLTERSAVRLTGSLLWQWGWGRGQRSRVRLTVRQSVCQAVRRIFFFRYIFFNFVQNRTYFIKINLVLLRRTPWRILCRLSISPSTFLSKSASWNTDPSNSPSKCTICGPSPVYVM